MYKIGHKTFLFIITSHHAYMECKFSITTISVMFFHCVNFSFGFVSSCPIPLLSFAISPFCVFSDCARLGFANNRKMSAISTFVAHHISGWTFLITGIMSSISTSETLIVVAERSSLPDSSSGVSSRMWVRIPAVTLVSLSKTLNHNCFSPPRG